MAEEPGRPEELAQLEHGNPRLQFGDFDSNVGGRQSALEPDFFGAWPIEQFVVKGAAGRSLVAATRLEPNQRVLSAEPIATAIVSEHRKRTCAVCLARSALPTGWQLGCKKCGQDFYCSIACSDAAQHGGHPRVCSAARRLASARAPKDQKTLVRLVIEVLQQAHVQQSTQCAQSAQSMSMSSLTRGEDASSGSGSCQLRNGWQDVLRLEAHAGHRSEQQRADDRGVDQMLRTALEAADPPFDIPGEDMIMALVSAVKCNCFGISCEMWKVPTQDARPRCGSSGTISNCLVLQPFLPPQPLS
jgi:hypothetical protein